MNELEQLDELELQEAQKIDRKQKYQSIQGFIVSKAFNILCESFKKLWKELENDIMDIVKNRIETKWEKSQIDIDYEFILFLIELKESLWESEGEKVIKSDIDEAIESVQSHIFNKKDEWYDLPIFSTLDILRNKRIEYMTVGERIRRIGAFYLDQKQEEMINNPY